MHTIIKFLISGGLAAIVDLLIIHFMDKAGFNYLISINVAFAIAFIVSFSFQKHWTFNDSSNSKIHKQLTLYLTLSGINVFINSILVHFLLYLDMVTQDFILRQLVWAQIIASAIVCVETFFISRNFIFKKEKVDISNKKINTLIVTQKLDMNDSYFGFFHDWVRAFAKESDMVTVISLETKKHDLPSNVKVLSLGKEEGKNKIKYLYLLFKYSFLERKNYDAVFCHMSPLYVITGFPLWKAMDKKIALWYVHRSVDLKLKIATLLSDIIFTATPESFGIKSKKVNYMGQSVDISKFDKKNNLRNEPTEQTKQNGILKIITVGRITAIKRLEMLIDTARELKDNNIPFEINIVGAPVMKEDIEYDRKIRLQIDNALLKDKIIFSGSVANKDIARMYWNSDIFVNLAPTGGLDKAVLEAMASSLPTFVSNTAFKPYLGKYSDDLIFTDSTDLYLKIKNAVERNKINEIGGELRGIVSDKSDLNNLIKDINKKILINKYQ